MLYCLGRDLIIVSSIARTNAVRKKLALAVTRSKKVKLICCPPCCWSITRPGKLKKVNWDTLIDVALGKNDSVQTVWGNQTSFPTFHMMVNKQMVFMHRSLTELYIFTWNHFVIATEFIHLLFCVSLSMFLLKTKGQTNRQTSAFQRTFP